MSPKRLQLTAAAWCGVQIALVLALVVGAGCASKARVEAGKKENAWALNPAWTPYTLYTAPAPHASLYVEVDSVEGMEPTEATLAALKEFLETYCDKPGGVQVQRSTRIRRNDARGYYRHELALLNMDGPPAPFMEPGPAYIYILFYDSSLEPRTAPAFQTRTAVATPAPESWRGYIGHVNYLPYPCAIYLNGRVRGGELDIPMLLHEAGHLLGPRPGMLYHCESRECLMHPSLRIRLRSFFLFQARVCNKTICERCREGLLQARTNQAPANLRFRGPCITRQETNYNVWSIPSLAMVLPEPLPPQEELPKILFAMKRMGIEYRTHVKTNRDTAVVTLIFENHDRPAEAKALLKGATNDWYGPVQVGARSSLSKWDGRPETRDQRPKTRD